MEKQTIDVNEAATYLGISKDLIYILVRKKEIPHFRIGQRILFRKITLDSWIAEQEAACRENEVKSKEDVLCK
jgi:excisionase family DNA binding protein